MLGFKLTNGRPVYKSHQRRKSLDVNEVKLPSINQSRRQLSKQLKLDISSFVSQRSFFIKKEKENTEVPESVPEPTIQDEELPSIEEDSTHVTQENALGQFVRTYEGFTVQGTTWTINTRIEPKPKPPPRKRNTLKYTKFAKPPVPQKKLMPEPTEQQLVLVKEAVHTEWIHLFRQAYGLLPLFPTNTYKCYIGKGNNSPLINQIMKTRWWWARTDDPAKANFVWTQLRHRPTIEKSNLEAAFCENVPVAITTGKPKYARSVFVEKCREAGLDLVKDSPWFVQSQSTQQFLPNELTVHNRLPNNWHICCKRRLLSTMSNYYQSLGRDPFSRIPLTFYIGPDDSQWNEFVAQYTHGSVWIVKPAEGTNRGNGIKVTASFEELQSFLSKANEGRSYIIQKYITNPLLVHKRKFDIRCYGLISCIGQQAQGFYYQEGYIRTACKEFTLKRTEDKFIHLTNDAIQKQSEEYGKYELGNKLSYKEFQKYLDAHSPGVNFSDTVLPQLQQVVAESMHAMHAYLKPSNTFEVFGYDFMVDDQLNVWLIEVNTNPCLELSSSYLAKVIPAMLDNAFQICLDPLFPPPPSKKLANWIQEQRSTNQFILVSSKCFAE